MFLETECVHCGGPVEIHWAAEIQTKFHCDSCVALGSVLRKQIAARRTEIAEQEAAERQARWLANCPPDHRKGHHLRIRDEESRSNKATVNARFVKVDPTKSRRQLKKKVYLIDTGMRVWANQTCTREEYFAMEDRRHGGEFFF